MLCAYLIVLIARDDMQGWLCQVLWSSKLSNICHHDYIKQITFIESESNLSSHRYRYLLKNVNYLEQFTIKNKQSYKALITSE